MEERDQEKRDTRGWRCISCPDSWKTTSQFCFQLWDSNTAKFLLPSDDEFMEISSFHCHIILLTHLQLPEDAALAACFQVLQSLRPEVLLLVRFCPVVSHSEPGVKGQPIRDEILLLSVTGEAMHTQVRVRQGQRSPSEGLH